jgi:hypothetical protein
MKMQACATVPLERLSPTPLHFPLKWDTDSDSDKSEDEADVVV